MRVLRQAEAVIVGSLFSGIGGLDLGLAHAGFRHAFFCEADPYRRRVLARHWPDVPCFHAVQDIAPRRDGRTGIRRAPDRGRPAWEDWERNWEQGPVDLLCGGFPCQDLSVAGRRAGLAGERSGLFFEFARVAAALLPAGGWVLLENVPGLLSSHGGRDFALILATLADLGVHDLAWRVLDSRYFGVPQRRRRVYLLGRRARGQRAAEVLLEPESGGGDFAAGCAAGEDIAGSLGGGAGARGWADDTDRATFVGTLGVGSSSTRLNWDGDYVAHAFRSEGFDASEDGTGRGIPLVVHATQDPITLRDATPAIGATAYLAVLGAPPDADGPGRLIAPALTKNYGKQPDNSDTNLGPMLAVSDARTVRRLTPRECERLQGFPDDWTGLPSGAPDSRRYAACGDAVTVPVAEWIGRRLMSHVRASP
jgi:DNA (cytosine-5)-methyltransferase 1